MRKYTIAIRSTCVVKWCTSAAHCTSPKWPFVVDTSKVWACDACVWQVEMSVCVCTDCSDADRKLSQGGPTVAKTDTCTYLTVHHHFQYSLILRTLSPPLCYLLMLLALPWQLAVFWRVLIEGMCIRGQMGEYAGPSLLLQVLEGRGSRMRDIKGETKVQPDQHFFLANDLKCWCCITS